MSVERQLLMAASGVSTQYTIAKSLRFRSSASAYLSRTLGASGSKTTWAQSLCVKRGLLGSNRALFSTSYTLLAETYVRFNASDQLEFTTYTAGGANYYSIVSTQVFRDPSAWYLIEVVFDTTNATAANRMRLYVNGLQITSFASAAYPPQNYAGQWNDSAYTHYIGAYEGASAFFDGYLADINFIDGQALTPSSFGETSTTTGVWIPKQYSGSYGTNGFYLKFTDTTSTTALGYDSSGNGNNWTPNNLSLTTGSTYDSMLDSPTNYDNGGNGVGNYAVWNSLANRGGSTLSSANLNVAGVGGVSEAPVTSTIGFDVSTNWYFELSCLTNTSTYGCAVGITNDPFNSSALTLQANGYSYIQNGTKNNNGSPAAYGASFTDGDVIGVAVGGGSITFYKNGVSQGVAYSGLSGTYFFATSDASGGGSGATNTSAANFGQRPFAYTPPTGYKALNTQNLSAPSIVNGAGYMAATTYTGTGASLSVSGAAFQPDLVWIKSRSAATDHALYDVIRGVQDRLESNTTDAEVTSDNGLTAFNSNGFTVNTLAQVNTNAATYIGWQWKAGGTAVTNNAGSITSSVSANTTAGFSVVTYTGIATPGTVGHGLGANLGLLIVKCRNNASSWAVWHTALSGNQYLLLESTAAVGTASTVWNGATPTSSVFSVGSGSVPNTAGYTYVAYCFAAIPGYSAFGSYTGNGSTDGPFVYCGFRPRYLMIKRTDSTGAWEIYDTSRSPYNVTGAKDLQADSSAAEGASGISLGYDILSNGFKNRDTTTYLNASGGTYVYAAFAENPFQNARAR